MKHKYKGSVENNPKMKILKTYILLTVFAIAMGFLEGIVVVYLRQVYYPRGFDFPLTLLTPEMLSVEVIREIATIVMLVIVAWIAGRNFHQRFSFFLFIFAVWDIFYYVALKLILDWPSSWFTWDILFLIPVPWIGPVLAPVICSFTMIFMSLAFNYLSNRTFPLHIRPADWILTLSGTGIIIFTFIRDYLFLIIRNMTGELKDNESLQEIITTYMPSGYSWILFIAGEFLIFSAFLLIIKEPERK